MNVNEVAETVRSFIGGIANEHPELLTEMRRMEIDFDADGVSKISTDVGVGMGVLRSGSSPSREPEPAVHVDVAVMAEWLGIGDGRWCHGTVDTDCILRVLAEESVGDRPGGGPLRQMFDALAVDPDRLRDELASIRPGPGTKHFPITVADGDGGWVGQRTPTGRFVLVVYRILRSRAMTSEQPVTPVDVLRSLLMEDQGPAAEALEALGVIPREARERLGIPEARPVEGDSMWPPAPNPREFSWPDDQRGPLPYVEPPSPSPDSKPSSFVWTSPAGHQLELSAVRNGPIQIRARAEGDVTVNLDSHTAEILARHLMDFHAQLEIERWEPVYDAEAHGRPKPPPPNPHP